jgi:ABC-2 type transport system permease protein
VAELVGDLRAYRHLVTARFRGDMQYRTSFVLMLVGQAAASGLDLVAIGMYFASVDALAGWTAPEVVFLFGLTGVGYSLADVVVSPVDRATLHIKAGTFDTFLLRPVGALWQLLAHEFATRRLGRGVQPLAALLLSAPRLDVAWGPAQLAMVLVALATGMITYAGLWVLLSSIAFWTVETQEVANSFLDGGRMLSSFPLDVMGGWLRRVATFVVPLASQAYLPACWLLGKPLPFGLPRVAAWAGPVVACGLVAAARVAWVQGIRHYRSTGS